MSILYRIGTPTFEIFGRHYFTETPSFHMNLITVHSDQIQEDTENMMMVTVTQSPAP